MSPRDAATAVRRFGLGPKPGDVKRIAADPRGYVLAQLADAKAARLDDPMLAAAHVVFEEMREAQRERKAARETAAAPGGKAGATATDAAPSMKVVTPPNPAAPMVDPNRVKPGAIRREAYREEAIHRIERARATETPLLERLVMFWSNHFCVSATKGPVRGLAGAFEREAIRPHVLGRFAGMLRAVEQHPAMLIYLDNAQSIGPNSKAGQNRAKGLNENLAREILELHTLGVGGGYTQGDVTNLARIITGWTVAGLDQAKVEPGRFLFTPQRHEPGTWSVLGKSYPDTGRAAGEECLDDLARHPATAKHIALKLARHFVADDPPPALVSRLEKTFRETEGDLAAVTRALVTSEDAWAAPPRKIVPPYDFAVSILRGLQITVAPPELVRTAAVLGQPLWSPPAPAGWPDADNSWMGPSPVRERLRVAEMVARMSDRLADPRQVADDLIGPALSEQTRQAVARAETREQGIELIVMSPEFLRR
jgi:uncharacterized protein (DUF1800 family)